MTHERLLRISERWFRTLLRLYPADFRDELGFGIVEAYQNKARTILDRSEAFGLARLWLRAFADAIRNGLGERLSPSDSWRRKALEREAASNTSSIVDNIARDVKHALRGFRRNPGFTLVIVFTLALGMRLLSEPQKLGSASLWARRKTPF